jgi:hypothetical protein
MSWVHVWEGGVQVGWWIVLFLIHRQAGGDWCESRAAMIWMCRKWGNAASTPLWTIIDLGRGGHVARRGGGRSIRIQGGGNAPSSLLHQTGFFFCSASSIKIHQMYVEGLRVIPLEFTFWRVLYTWWVQCILNNLSFVNIALRAARGYVRKLVQRRLNRILKIWINLTTI